MHPVDALLNPTSARSAGSGRGARTLVFCLLASFAGSTIAATLTGRAVLPAVTFAPGPTSGKLIGAGPFIRVLLDDALDVEPEVLVRPPLLTAREELLAAAHAALMGAFDDAGGSGALALAAIKRARDLFRLHEPKMLKKRLHRLLEAKKLTGVALDKVELGRSEQAAAGFIAARRLIGEALPRVKH